MKLLLLCVASTSLLIGCTSGRLDLQPDGRVVFTGEYPTAHSLNETGGRFVMMNGCILFEQPSGKRVLPIFRPGLRFGPNVEPGKLRLGVEYAVGGINPNSRVAAKLRNDPVAKRCGAPPTFIADVGAPRTIPPPR